MPKIDKRACCLQSIVVGTIHHKDKSVLFRHGVMPKIVIDHMARANLPNCKDGTRCQRGVGWVNVGYHTSNWRRIPDFHGLYIEACNAQSNGSWMRDSTWYPKSAQFAPSFRLIGDVDCTIELPVTVRRRSVFATIEVLPSHYIYSRGCIH